MVFVQYSPPLPALVGRNYSNQPADTTEVPMRLADIPIFQHSNIPIKSAATGD